MAIIGAIGELPRTRIAAFALIEEAEASRIRDNLVDAGRLATCQDMNGMIRYELPANTLN